MADAITARTAPDMPVAEQVAFLKTILESSTEYSIVAKDLNGNILAWNEGAHRLPAASAQPPNLVVLDLVMPQVDGFEFLRRFRATTHGRNTPVIVLTGKNLLKQEQEMLAAMAQCVVNKGDGSVQVLLAEISTTLVHATVNNQAAIADG